MENQKKIYVILTEYISTQDIPEAEKKAIIDIIPDVFFPIEYVNSQVGIDDKTYSALERVVSDSQEESITGDIRVSKSDGIPTLFRATPKIDASLLPPVDKYFLEIVEKIKEKNERSDSLISFREGRKFSGLLREAGMELLPTQAPKSQEELDKIILDHPGKSVLRSSGDQGSVYAHIDLSSISTGSGINVKGASYVLFTGKIQEELTLSKCKNIALEDVKSTLKKVSKNKKYYHLSDSINIRITQSYGVFLGNSDIYGKKISTDDLSTIMQGIQPNNTDVVIRPRAIRVQGGGDVTIMDCDTRYVFNSFDLLSTQKAHCQYNISHYVISDTFHCQGLKKSNILDNYRGKVLAFQQDADFWNSSDGKVHADFIQFMQASSDNPTCWDVTLDGNMDLCDYIRGISGSAAYNLPFSEIFEDSLPLVAYIASVNHGIGVQGILLQAEAGGYHSKITVKNNVIYSTQNHPLTIKNTQCGDLVTSNNTCVVGVNNNTSSSVGENVQSLVQSNCSNVEALIVV